MNVASSLLGPDQRVGMKVWKIRPEGLVKPDWEESRMPALRRMDLNC